MKFVKRQATPGGGHSLYKLYRYGAAPKGMVFVPFWSELHDFDRFGLKEGKVRALLTGIWYGYYKMLSFY